jgi:hypothetical protein
MWNSAASEYGAEYAGLQVTSEGCHDESFGLATGSFSGTYEDFLACYQPDDRVPVKTG